MKRPDLISATAAWQALRAHQDRLRKTHLRDLFAADPDRFQRFSLEVDGMLVDFSKSHATTETLSLLLDLARTADLEGWRARMFAGETVNNTENRAALHMALRAQKALRPEVATVLDKMRSFVSGIESGAMRGATGKTITHVINIGIGGSDLGPAMAVAALRPYHVKEIEVRFVSNVDGAHLDAALKGIDPARIFFIVASKTFTTQETMANAKSARDWLIGHLGAAAVSSHFAAVSTNAEAVTAFGIAPERMFEFWDWVGGRYSLWSAIGLSIALAVGWKNFQRLLEGAHAMDRHFLETPLKQNVPALLGLLDCWYADFWATPTRAVLPYAQDLHLLPAYLQQLLMESNGKRTTREGSAVDYPTSPVIWGQAGTNGQHAFYQMLHQGTQLVPCDFILTARGNARFPAQHRLLTANGLAQAQAMMLGRTAEEAVVEMEKAGLDGATVARLLPFRTFPGNQPSVSIVLPALDPYSLGLLLALYEHRAFAQGTLWGLNPFDQWGVELGKRLADDLLAGNGAGRDSSTAGLSAYLARCEGSLKKP